MKKILSIAFILISLNVFAQGKFDVQGDLAPTGQYGIVKARNLRGGYYGSVYDTVARNLIPSTYRDSNMLVFTRLDSTMWMLKGGLANSNWAVFSTGGGTATIDSFIYSTRAWRQKGDDSLGALINLKPNFGDIRSEINDSLSNLNRIKAAGSGGGQLQNSSGQSVISWGAGGSTNANIGNLSIGTALTFNSENVVVSSNLPYIDAYSNGIKSTNSAATNTTNLQSLIDANTSTGAIIFFKEAIPINGGLILKKNVKLYGNNVTAWKGSGSVSGANSFSATPTGATFMITDQTNVFIKVQTNTAIEGIMFYYPNQLYTATAYSSLIQYPATIQKASGFVQSLSFRKLTFVGEWQSIDLRGDLAGTQDIDFDQIYAYPLSGKCLDIYLCYDIPRINRVHINPGVGQNFLGANANGLPFGNTLIDSVTLNGGSEITITTTDEFMVTQCFMFGVNIGFEIQSSYGTIMQSNVDMARIGVFANLAPSPKFVNIIGCNFIMGGGALNSRYAVYFSGGGGTLSLTSCGGFVGTNTVVPSSSNPGADAFIGVVGSGTQRVLMTGMRTGAWSGAWNYFTKITNGSAIVTYPDSYQSGVTNTAAAGILRDVTINNINNSARINTSSLKLNVDSIGIVTSGIYGMGYDATTGLVKGFSISSTGFTPNADTTVTGNYTITARDMGRNIWCSSSSNINITLPQDSDASIPFTLPAPQKTFTVWQIGTGSVTVVAGTGATIEGYAGGIKSIGQYIPISGVKRAANTWIYAGGTK